LNNTGNPTVTHIFGVITLIFTCIFSTYNETTNNNIKRLLNLIIILCHEIEINYKVIIGLLRLHYLGFWMLGIRMDSLKNSSDKGYNGSSGNVVEGQKSFFL